MSATSLPPRQPQPRTNKKPSDCCACGGIGAQFKVHHGSSALPWEARPPARQKLGHFVCICVRHAPTMPMLPPLKQYLAPHTHMQQSRQNLTNRSGSRANTQRAQNTKRCLMRDCPRFLNTRSPSARPGSEAVINGHSDRAPYERERELVHVCPAQIRGGAIRKLRTAERTEQI